jgi:phosphopantothenoylcysteine decarboxylase/phosphopantothenate--cysteine ligase
VWLARLLAQAGAEVDVVMTRAAREFVGPITFEAVTGRPVHSEIFGPGHALDHISLARSADVIVVAPATADFIGRAAHGLADDLLTACLLATRAKVLLIPAMNDRMWSHPGTVRNVEQARTLGYHVIDPADGPLAVGEGSGPGRMIEPEDIMSHVGRALEAHASLSNRRVVVTAGATREPIDPVRFISNHSSGKMGVAIARAAWRRGADVILIAGHVDIPLPGEVTVVRTGSTEEMGAAVADALPTTDVLFMAAAPTDFRAAAEAPKKIKKGGAPPSLELEHTDDILRTTMSKRRRGGIIVGFALETGDGVAHARTKLKEKKLDLIVMNDATEPGAGFGVDTNRVTLIDDEGNEERLELMSKVDLAEVLLDRVEARLNGR